MAEKGRLTHLPSSKRIVGGKSFPISCEHVLCTHWWAMKIGRLYSAVLVFVASSPLQPFYIAFYLGYTLIPRSGYNYTKSSLPIFALIHACTVVCTVAIFA